MNYCSHPELVSVRDTPGVLRCTQCDHQLTGHEPGRPLNHHEQRLIIGSQIQALLQQQTHVPYGSVDFHALQDQIDELKTRHRTLRPTRFIHKSRGRDGNYTYPCPDCGRPTTMTLAESNGALTNGMLACKRCPECFDRHQTERSRILALRDQDRETRLAPHANELATNLCRFCQHSLDSHTVLGCDSHASCQCRRVYQPTGGTT